MVVGFDGSRYRRNQTGAWKRQNIKAVGRQNVEPRYAELMRSYEKIIRSHFPLR